MEVIWGQNISAIRKPIHDFLSYFYWHFLYLVPFSRYSTSKFLVFHLDLWHERSTGVKNISAIQKPIHDVLSCFYWHFLSRTVSKIFDFKVFKVWPWPLIFRGHLGSKIFLLFESSYTTSYLTPIDTFYLSRTVFEKIRVNIFRVKQNGGFWLFQGQGHRPIFLISRKRSDSH